MMSFKFYEALYIPLFYLNITSMKKAPKKVPFK